MPIHSHPVPEVMGAQDGEFLLWREEMLLRRLAEVLKDASALGVAERMIREDLERTRRALAIQFPESSPTPADSLGKA